MLLIITSMIIMNKKLYNLILSKIKSQIKEQEGLIVEKNGAKILLVLWIMLLINLLIFILSDLK